MQKITIALARRPAGRIALHIAAILRGGKFAWHFAGIMREVRA